MDLILGVDGGATKTIVNITDRAGRLLANAISKSSNYKSTGIKKTIENINYGVLGAIKKLNEPDKAFFKSACFGVSGYDFDRDLNIYKNIVFNNEIKSYLDPKNTIICNDTRIGLEAGSNNENKIIIICGTGSNCFGVNKNKEEARTNGWDYILGDEGSGYRIGIKALRALMRAYDGRGSDTLLSKTILEDLNAGSIFEIVEWIYGKPFSKVEIAAIAKTVCRTAEIGDKISIKILKEEAGEAFISIITVANKLNLKDKDFDLVFVGNIFKCKKYFKEVLMEKLKDEFPKINFKPLTKKPVKGAIKFALKYL